MILNNPANPTGDVYTREDVCEIAEALKPFPNTFVLSDEIYDHLVYDNVDGDGRVINDGGGVCGGERKRGGEKCGESRVAP